MENFATPYPVIFNDGDAEHDKGEVGVHSSLTFKRFASMMSQKSGLAAAQISTVFVCRKTPDAEKRQRLPINENTNFGIILSQHNPANEKDCFFLVSTKKSKKDRKNTKKKLQENEVDSLLSSSGSSNASSPRKAPGTPKRQPDEMTLEPEDKDSASDQSSEDEKQSEASACEKCHDHLSGVAANPDSPKVGVPESSSKQPSGDWIHRSSSPENHLPEDLGNTSGSEDTRSEGRGQSISPTSPLLSGRSPAGVTRPDPGVPFNKAPGLPASVNLSHMTGQPHMKAGEGPVRTSQGMSNSAFSLFGYSQHGLDLLHSVAARAGMHPMPLCCRLCKFCRDRSLQVPFHWCVDDQVVSGFRGPSPAGPICRPARFRFSMA